MGTLDGKSAIVTGAGRGIGRAVAQLLAAEGASVIVNDIGAALDGSGGDTSVAQLVVDEIEAAGGTALANTDSITDYDAAEAMVQQAVDNFGKLDILVHVAGILRDRMIFNMNDDEWDAVIDVHLKGSFNLCKWAAVHFRERREGGRIINFSSTSAWGSAGQPNYAAAKYGLLGFTATLANSLNRYGVTANAILPYAATRMIDSTPRAMAIKEETGKLPSELAEGTEGDPANVAPMVAYLASDAAAMINGHFFGVSGNSISVYSHWELAGVLSADRRWNTNDLVEIFPDTAGRHMAMPEAVDIAGRMRRGTLVWQSDPTTWKDLGDGVELWERTHYFDAKSEA